ncbi:MAG: prevent-host-death protein, partial [Eubacteriales bacterium]|nr:prevent-host-death protein [Eubacteriales bacterium]
YFTVREKALDYQYGGKKVSYEEFLEINEKSTLRISMRRSICCRLPTSGTRRFSGVCTQYLLNTLKARNA